MGAYRKIMVDIWQDPFFVELSVPDKLFFFYLLTNSKSTQHGIFEISLKIMAFDTKLSQKVLLSQIERFIQWGKIAYDPLTKEMMVLNWMKYNVPDNPSVLKHLTKGIQQVRSPVLMALWTRCTQGAYTVCPQKEKEKQKEEPKPKEKQGEEEGQGKGKVKKELKKKENEAQASRDSLSQSFKDKETPEPKAFELVTDTVTLLPTIPPILEGADCPPASPLPMPALPLTDLLPPDLPPTQSFETEHTEIIVHLNQKAGTVFRADNRFTLGLVSEKLLDGYTVSDFMAVIDKKALEWKGTIYEVNLTPQMLFQKRFDGYLHQKKTFHYPPVPSSVPRDGSVFTNTEFREVFNQALST